MLKLLSAAAVATVMSGSAIAQTQPGPTNPNTPPTTQMTPGTGSGPAPMGPAAEPKATPGTSSVPKGTNTSPAQKKATDKLDTPSAGGGK